MPDRDTYSPELDLWLSQVHFPVDDPGLFWVRFSSPERHLPSSPGVRLLSIECRARLLGLSPEDYSDAVERLREYVFNWADERRSEGRRPSIGEGPVVALGDSLTADRGSWFEHLRALCDDVTFVNLARAGDTTADALGRLGWFLSLNPTWVFVMIGTNDSASFLPARDVSLISHSETIRNLGLMRDVLSATAATQVWMTPMGVDESALERTWAAGDRPWVYENPRLALLADAVRSLTGVTVVDLFEAKPRANRFEDGIHPTIEEHQRIADYVLTTLKARPA